MKMLIGVLLFSQVLVATGSYTTNRFERVVTEDGKELLNARPLRIEPDHIVVFSHSAGIDRIPAQHLPDPILSAIGYPTREDVARARREREESERQASQRNRDRLEAEMRRRESLPPGQRFELVLRDVGIDRSLIRTISQRESTISLTVGSSWHSLSYTRRYDMAQVLWRSWASIYSPNEPDKAYLEIRDVSGRRVGGSRWLAGSLIWVDR